MNKEIAILFKKKVYTNEEIEFIPIKVIEGIYNNKDTTFIDNDGTPYYHIIENPDSFGYCYRDSIINYKENYKHLTLPLIKALLLRTIKKYAYTYNIDSETSAPIILFTNKKTNEKNILIDEEINNFYTEKYRDYYDKYLNPKKEKEEEKKEELDIKKIYENIISIIIDQDEAIKKILSIIWKQTLGFKTPNKNIIIDGPSGVGKSKICKLLTEQINIPSVTLSASSGKIIPAEHLILDLVKRAYGDIPKAQNGIIIIDKFEDFIMYSSPEGRGELEKLLQENNLIISSTAGDFIFDTSNLIIIGITNLDKIKPSKKQITGFNGTKENNINKDILELFSIPIKLNLLNYDSYIKILNSQKGLLSQNIELLKQQGVKLEVSDIVKDKMAKSALTSDYKVKDLEAIIEKTLEVAEFEIASNPNLYSELIITQETLNNSSSYKLIKNNK